MTLKEHWDLVYTTKASNEVSWFQKKPVTSIDFIKGFFPGKNARIIDIGGGDSHLVDHLLDEGYENITVLDISSKALYNARKRLKERADKVKWIQSNVLEFDASDQFDIWHDRAAFHFLTQPEEVNRYLSLAARLTSGFMTLSTFSTDGPKKCSGLPVSQYNEDTIEEILHDKFEKIKCIREDHLTPSNTFQNFLICSFKVKEKN